MRIALVHDYLTQYGGAERVLEALHQRYPNAPVFTGLLDRAGLPASFDEMDIRPSSLNRIPGAGRNHRLFTPFYPAAFRHLGRALRDFDVVLADSSAWAHHVGVRPEQTLVCYCHSPARFLYSDADYLNPAQLHPAANFALNGLAGGLRALDERAARRVGLYIANSRNVAKRIERVYGREARIVYPPIDLNRFSSDAAAPVKEEDWFLVVSRLVPHKWINLAVEACTRAGIPLKIIGDGRARADLETIAGPTIEFLGQRDDDDVVAFLRRCKALILPGAEDFGMTAVEAQAVGRPVLAYGKGGALESVVDGETGLFFNEQSADSLLDAIGRFESRSWTPSLARENAERFGQDRFASQIDEEIQQAIREKHGSR